MGSEKKMPKRITVCNSKGGSSKTSTCRNLGVIAARSGFNVALFDLDEQKTLTNWYDERPKNMVRMTLVTGTMADIGEIAELDDFDLAFIDTPPLTTGLAEDSDDRQMHELMRKVIAVSDMLIVPSGQQKEDWVSSIAWMDYLKMRHAKYAALLSATTRRSKSFEVAKNQILRAGHSLCPKDIPRVEDIPLSYTYGIGVVEMKGAKGAEDYESVWAWLRGELGIAAKAVGE